MQQLSEDRKKQIQAMCYLESIFEPMDENGTPKPQEWIDAYITAAHYLVQSMLDGYEPDNYDEVMAEAAKFDAIDEANCLRYLAENRTA